MRSGLAKKREKEKLDGNERREIGNRSLKSSHIFLQTEGGQKRPSLLEANLGWIRIIWVTSSFQE